MSGLRDYTSVAAGNIALFPENMNPSAVDDGLRQVQADVVSGYRDSEWANWGDVPSRASALTFKITGDVTSRYLVNRRIRCNDASTVYGAITASSYSAPDTTVTLELDSGSLTASLTAVAIASSNPLSHSLPKNIVQETHLYAADAGSTDAYAITLSPVLASYTTGMIIRFKANTANTGAATLNVNSLGAKTIKKNVSSDLDDNDILASQLVEVIYDGTNFQLISPPAILTPPFVDSFSIVKGSSDATKKVRIEADGITTATTRVWTAPDSDLSQFLVQKVHTQTGAVATGTTILPFDDTIPQNGEGDQYLSLAITPKNTANILYIQVTINLCVSVNTRYFAAALFQDSTASALASSGEFRASETNSNAGTIITFSYKMTAGTTSATTFKVRAGPDAAATLTMNGTAGVRRFGGVEASSMTITEVTP